MYLIVGANGFLGAYFIKEILASTEERILATARQTSQVPDWGNRVSWLKLDVTNRDEVQALASQLKDEINSVKVVYLAAYHHPDQVEKHPQMAWDINITSLSYFLNCIGNVRRFVYSSTESVYGEGGMDSRLAEDSKLYPANRYGRHKTVAEALVTGYGYNVVRYPFLIAPSILAHKKHFYDVIVDTITAGKSMKMFKDSFRTALDFGTAARLTVALMEKKENIPNVVNVSGDDVLSKYDIGCMIAEKCGVDKKYIEPVSVGEIKGVFDIPRAEATLLDNSLLKEVLGLKEIKLKF